MDLKFEGRRAVIVGAGSGIGLATTRMLVMRGASVLGVARSASGLEAIRSMGVDALGADATAHGVQRRGDR